MLEEQRVGAQQTLDELFSEGLLPFALSAQKLESIGNEEYIMRFHQSRLSSVDVSCRGPRTSALRMSSGRLC